MCKSIPFQWTERLSHRSCDALQRPVLTRVMQQTANETATATRPLTGRPVISATGLFTPEQSITNEELVASFNDYVDRYNAANAEAIEAGDVEALQPSSVEFIEKASGIKSRHVMSKEPILDPDIMTPRLNERPDQDLSVMAEIGVIAAKQALERAGRDPKDVDAVLCAASNMQRPYPAMAIEIQQALGIDGFGFDMNVACSSATFAISTAKDMITAGNFKKALNKLCVIRC